MKRLLTCMLALAMLLAAMPVAAATEPYRDVPDDWAAGDIYAARDAGLMAGTGNGLFGYGSEISRQDFVIILCRMFGWSTLNPSSPSFADVPQGAYYYPYVEAARANGVTEPGLQHFEPGRPITRGEMATMLVRALGYAELADSVARYGHGFTDVPEALAGYITVAVDIGMTNGLTATTFGPNQTAKREQAAAMMMRVYRRLSSNTDWLHGFYAFSSYDQRTVIADMDAVSMGWSRMCLDGGEVWLNTSRSGGNEWSIPASYESITGYLDQVGRPAHLDVFMDMTAQVALSEGGQTPALRALLASPILREQAVQVIVGEATRPYEAIGKSPYSGVTIDFEGLRAQDKEGFSAFVASLSAQLKTRGLGLYVAVQPAVYGEAHFDGYDFRAIGEAADKVILMAHDYHPTSLSGLAGTTWHLRTPLTPFDKVYYALRAATDKDTGVSDPKKLALAISFSSIGWELTADGRVAEAAPVTPPSATLAQRLSQPDAARGWSDTYRNPYVTYQTGGKQYCVWYEDERSVSDKITLARLFGVTGVSVWRIGNISNVPGTLDVWSVLKAR